MKIYFENCSVLYCVVIIICTLIRAVLTGELWPVGLGLVSLCVCFFMFFS